MSFGVTLELTELISCLFFFFFFLEPFGYTQSNSVERGGVTADVFI